MGNKGHWRVCFLLSRTSGSIWPSTLPLCSASKQQTPHRSKNMLLAYLWCQLLCWRKGSIPATLSKTGQITLHSSSLLPSPHLFSAGQPNNSIMNMKCLLIDVYGSWSGWKYRLLDMGLTWLSFCFTSKKNKKEKSLISSSKASPDRISFALRAPLILALICADEAPERQLVIQ